MNVQALARAGGILVMGLAATWLFVGTRVLNPENIAWIPVPDGDTIAHYMGWVFYRNSSWTWPLGLNPTYGLEVSNSIVYSDSIPFIAIPLKALNTYLPETFQYFGIWLLFCFLMQAAIGYRLISLFITNTWVRFIGVGFLLSAPPMLWRIHGHKSLVGHFLLLAALYLFMRPDRHKHRWLWVLLLVISTGVHAYIAAMVALFWIADLLRDGWTNQRGLGVLLSELCLGLTITGLAAWQFGYFTVGTYITGGGFGYYKMNLLSVIDPNNWSYILPDIPGQSGEYEGFNYLGLGLLILVLWAIFWIFKDPEPTKILLRRYKVLLAIVILLIISATALRPAFGPWEVDWAVPWLVEESVGGVLRSSGRLFWPVFYLIILGVFWVLSQRVPHRVLVPALCLTLAVQLADTSRFWWPERQTMQTAVLDTELQGALVGAFWDDLGQHYDVLRHLPPQRYFSGWARLAGFAARHGMSTDVTYLARVNRGVYRNFQAESLENALTDDGASRTLFIISPDIVDSVQSSLDPEQDLLAEQDGYWVWAPGFKTR